MIQKIFLSTLIGCMIASMLVVLIITATLVFAPRAVKAYVYEVATYAAKYVKVATVHDEEDVATIVAYATSTPSTTLTGGIQLVDVSNAIMYPHEWSGEVRVSKIELTFDVDAPNVASTTLLIGTIASTSDPGIADVYWFDTVTFDTFYPSDAIYQPHQRVVLDYSPSMMKLGNKDSATARALPNNNLATTTGFLMRSTTFQELSSSAFATTTLAKFSPLGDDTYYFGSGDLVARIRDYTGATGTTTIKTFYHVK